MLRVWLKKGAGRNFWICISKNEIKIGEYLKLGELFYVSTRCAVPSGQNTFSPTFTFPKRCLHSNVILEQPSQSRDNILLIHLYVILNLTICHRQGNKAFPKKLTHRQRKSNPSLHLSKIEGPNCHKTRCIFRDSLLILL